MDWVSENRGKKMGEKSKGIADGVAEVLRGGAAEGEATQREREVTRWCLAIRLALT